MEESNRNWITFDERQSKGIHILALACPWCYEQVEVASTTGRLERVCSRCFRIFHIRITATRHYPKRRTTTIDPAELLGLAEEYSTRQLARQLGVSHNTVARWVRDAKKEAEKAAEGGIREIGLDADPAECSDSAASAAPEPAGEADGALETPIDGQADDSDR